MNLETGEALVSFLDAKGAPSVVERAKILFPLSQIGAITEGQRLDSIKQSRIYGKYDKALDRESAFEVLLADAERELQKADETAGAEGEPKESKSKKSEKGEKSEKSGKASKKKQGMMSKVLAAVMTAVTSTIATLLGTYVSNKVSGKETKSKTSAKEKVVKNATSAATRTITKELTRDILGNLTK